MEPGDDTDRYARPTKRAGRSEMVAAAWWGIWSGVWMLATGIIMAFVSGILVWLPPVFIAIGAGNIAFSSWQLRRAKRRPRD